MLPAFRLATSDCVAVSGETVGRSVAESQGQTSFVLSERFSESLDPSSIDAPPVGSL